MQKRGLMILRGMSFRKGMHGSLNIYDSEAVEEQILATESHKKLVEKVIEKYNIEFDIALDTVETPHTHLLFKILGKHLKKYCIRGYHDLTQVFSFQRPLYNWQFLIAEYDFVFVVRNDILLKEQMIETLNPHDDKLMFPFVEAYEVRYIPENKSYPRHSDCMMYFPKRYFHTLSGFNFYQDAVDFHDFLYKVICNIDSTVEYDFYIKTYHYSHTVDMWNPLFEITNRFHSDEKPNMSLTYPEDF